MHTYRIASFNAYKYSTNSSKSIEMIAKIIKDNEIDILAIQEIYSKAAMQRIVQQLNSSHWEGKWGTPNSKSATAAEGYAFIWNKDRISLSSNRSGKRFEPVVHNQYPHRDGLELIRNPFYGRFVPNVNHMIEFRLINTHIMFSADKTLNESEDHDTSVEQPGAVKMRKQEFEILATKILPKLEDKVYDAQWGEVDDICRKPYTILLGDYNLNLRDSAAKDTFIDPLIVVEDANSKKEIITIQKDLSTLQAKSKETGKIEGYRNNFDHFTYDKQRPMYVKSWAIDAPNNPVYYAGDFDKYKKDVSDHLMVVMEIKFM